MKSESGSPTEPPGLGLSDWEAASMSRADRPDVGPAWGLEGPTLSNSHPALRRCWHPVGTVDEIGEGPTRVMLLGEPWAIVRLGDTVSAFVDRCVHRLAPLSEGRIIDGRLECCYHGWRYDETGRCVLIPALGESGPVPAGAKVRRAFGAMERYGLVWVAIDEPICPVLEVPEWDEPRMIRGMLDPQRSSMSAGYLVDNFLDFAHFPFLHANTIGAAEGGEIDDYRVERHGWRFSLVYRGTFRNLWDDGVQAGIRPLVQERTMNYTYVAPFSVRVVFEQHATGGVMVVVLFVQPESDRESRLYTYVFDSNVEGGEQYMKESLAFEQAVLDEDLALQARYDVKELPLDLHDEFHTRADRITVELRRVLRDLVEAAS
jgi:phenylpropionate dioxygenase-like ring-hydroxylating dioxygenase large terminal subunit